MVHSDDPNTEIVKGTKVIYRGRLIGEVVFIEYDGKFPPMFYVKADATGTTFVAELQDLQNINDKREG